MPRTNIQIFACPDCAKLYKRRVDIWIDFDNPIPPSSPQADIPRLCKCGRVFLLAESTVIANLSPSDRPGKRKRSRNELSEWGLDEIEIPAFLRKRDDNAPPVPKPTFFTWVRKAGAWLFKGLKASTGLLATPFKPKPLPPKKSTIVKDVLWEMEALALPEQIAPKPPN